MKISVIGDIIYDSLNEKELDIMRHFSRTELKAAINMLKEFTAKGNFAVLMYMGILISLRYHRLLIRI